jgi:hypothetical protein
MEQGSTKCQKRFLIKCAFHNRTFTMMLDNVRLPLLHSVFGLNFNVNIYENFTKNDLYALGEQVYKRHIVFLKLGHCDGSNRRCRRHCYRPPD